MREERTSHGQGVYQWDSDHLYRILLEFRYLIRQALDINIPLFDDSCNGVSSFMTRERHSESWETLYVMKGTICHDSSPQVIYNTTCHKGLPLRLFPEWFFQISISAFPPSPAVSLCPRLKWSATMLRAHCPRKLKTARPHCLVHDTCRCITCSEHVPTGRELGMLEPVCPIPNPSQAGYIQSRIVSGLVGLKRDLDGVAGVLGQPDCYRKTNRAKKKKNKNKNRK